MLQWDAPRLMGLGDFAREIQRGGKVVPLVRMRGGKTEQCSKQGRWSKLKQSYLTWPLH